MTRDPHDVVKVYSGPIEIVEAHQATLGEAGIESKIVGTALSASFGSALPGSTELWVHQADFDTAVDMLVAGDVAPAASWLQERDLEECGDSFAELIDSPPAVSKIVLRP